MRELMKTLNGQRWRVLGWSAAGALLLTPLAAMQWTEAVDWTASDFLFAGGLIAGCGLAVELLLRASKNWTYRAAALAALATAAATVSIHGAVGLIGDGGYPANRLMIAVAAVAVAGSALARFRAGGMAGAMLATAAVQAGLAAYALSIGVAAAALGLGLLACGWLAAAVLFRVAAPEPLRD